jgi:MFS family permease
VTNVYRSLFAIPHARGMVLAAFLGRLPMSMLGIGTVLLISWVTGSYGLAGAVTATGSLAMAAVAPQLGRLTDRFGQRAVLLPGMAVYSAGVVCLVAATLLHAPDWVLYVAAVPMGGAFPSCGTMVRARWAALLADDSQRLSTAYSLESALDEVVFIVGPVLVTVLSTGLHPAAGLLATLVFLLTGGIWFANQRQTQPTPVPHQHRDGASAVRVPGLWVVAICFAALGAVFATIEVATVGFADDHGHKALAGVMLATFALGSMVSGFGYGARSWRAPLHARFLVGLGALAAALVPVALATSVPVLSVCSFVAGLAISPTLIAAFGLVETLVPKAALTEGFAWLNTALGLGLAVGASAAGRAVDVWSGHVAFRVALVAVAVAVSVPLLAHRPLRPVTAAPTATPTGENPATG